MAYTSVSSNVRQTSGHPIDMKESATKCAISCISYAASCVGPQPVTSLRAVNQGWIGNVHSNGEMVRNNEHGPLLENCIDQKAVLPLPIITREQFGLQGMCM